MDQHFKLLRADEDILCLNIEIQRLVTYMVDEEAFLRREEECLRAEGKEGLAIQAGLLCMECGRFTTLHMSRLVKLSKVPGFTGSILPGVSICREHHTPVVRDGDTDIRAPSRLPPPEDDSAAAPAEDDDVDVQSDDEDGMMAEAFMNIVCISRDDGTEAEGR
jgi:hypothetical protein